MINRLFDTWSKLLTTAQRRWRWVGYGLTGLAFLYLAALIIVSREQIQQIQWRSYWAPFFTALLVYLASLMIQFLVWTRLVSFHHRISWRDMAIYFRVLIMRRLPGGIWHWVDRTAMYTGVTEMPGRVVMLANFLEWSLLLLLAGAIGIAGWQSGPAWLRGLLAGAIILLALFLAYSWQPKDRWFVSRAIRVGFLGGNVFACLDGRWTDFVPVRPRNPVGPIRKRWLHPSHLPALLLGVGDCWGQQPADRAHTSWPRSA